MLVYVRRDASDGLEVDPPAIPSVVQQKLQEIDRELTTRMEEYIAEETECHRKFKIKRDQKREIYRVWNEPSDTEEALLMDKDALSAWLTAELVPEKKQVKKAAKGEASKVNGKADASDSESDTVEVTSVRVSRTSPHESQAHMNGNGTTKHKGLWKESPVSGTRLASEEPAKQKSEGETDADEDLPDLAKIFSRSRPLASTNGNPASTDQSAVNGHAVSKDSLDHQEPAPPATQSGARRGKGMRQVRQIWSESLICSHGNVKPSAASQMKRISSTGVQLLAAADIDIRPQFVTPDNLCRQCVFEPIQSRRTPSFLHVVKSGT